MFKFNPETHTYTLNGIELPSITQVLPYEIYDDLPDCREKGKAIHRMCYLVNIGKTDVEIMTDHKLIAWFQNDKFENYLKAYHDLRCYHKFEGIYDIKAGSPHPATPLQLAAQWLLANEGSPKYDLAYEKPIYHPVYRFAGTPDIVMHPKKRIHAVYLKDNGKFKLEDHTKDLRKNTQIFLSYLTVFKHRKENNL